MTTNYINTGFVPGNSDYTDVMDVKHARTVNFQAKSTNVKVATATQRMGNATLVLIQPFGVKACDSDACEVGQLNQSIKVQINFKYGGDSAITEMRAELNRLLDIWQAENLAYGVVPPVDTNLNAP